MRDHYTVINPMGKKVRYTPTQWNMAFVIIFVLGVLTGMGIAII